MTVSNVTANFPSDLSVATLDTAMTSTADIGVGEEVARLDKPTSSTVCRDILRVIRKTGIKREASQPINALPFSDTPPPEYLEMYKYSSACQTRPEQQQQPHWKDL